MIAREPAACVSARWVQYVRPHGEIRERCVCGSPQCGIVIEDEDGARRRVGTAIADGRLVYVTHAGLILFLCWQRCTNLGRAEPPALTERARRSANRPQATLATASPTSPTPARGLLYRIVKWLRER